MTIGASSIQCRGQVQPGSSLHRTRTNSLGATLVDVNPGAAMPQAMGVDMYYQMRLYLIPDGDLTPIAAHLR